MRIGFWPVLLALWAGLAGAEDWQVAGHAVSLTEAPDGGYRLVADGQVMAEDWLLLADPPAVVAGVEVISGVMGPGGNACDAAPFVLALPAGGPARLDGPVETCSYLEPSFTPDAITWTSAATPARDGESWIWTPAGGFVPGPMLTFTPDPTLGWAEISGLADQHPVEALRLAPVYAALHDGLGADWPAFAERLSGLGSGQMEGRDYFGQACIKEICDTDFAGIWLDAARQAAFVFWSDGSGMHLFPADRAKWPQGALAQLAANGG